MFHPIVALLLLAGVSAGSPGSFALERHAGRSDRPPPVDGVVHLDPTESSPAAFPRYFNQLGVRRIRFAFTGAPRAHRRFSVVWTGGSKGPDRFEVLVDGIPAGQSSIGQSERYPYRWNRDEFLVRLADRNEHTIELLPVEGFASEIEFTGFRLAELERPPYRPLCYESIGDLVRYEKALGERGVVFETDNLAVFAPRKLAAEAKDLAALLERAHDEMEEVFGLAPAFRFSVEHYPEGHERGWGGISGAATIGYPMTALEKFKRHRTRDVRGFDGYTEEMTHGFKGVYRCGGTSEALGLVIQEDIVRRLVGDKVARPYWRERHRQWEETTRAFREAGERNPDPQRYPENLFMYRILCGYLHKLRQEYGETFWTDFFAVLRQMDFPFHRVEKAKRLAVYADAFSILFGRSMREEFRKYGFDLETGGLRGE